MTMRRMTSRKDRVPDHHGNLYLVTKKKFHVNQDLVVPAAGRVDLFTGITQFLGKQQLYLRMHVLYPFLNGELSLADKLIDIP